MLCYTNMHICMMFSALKKIIFHMNLNLKVFFKKEKALTINRIFFYINVIFVDAKTFRLFWHVPIL